MRVNVDIPVPKRFWKSTITIPEGGTIAALATKNGLTGGELRRKVDGLSTPSERGANLEGSLLIEGYSYTGLSEKDRKSVV